MPTVYRRDETVTDHLGNPVMGVTVYVCSQPANTVSFRPTPTVQLYSDPLGMIPLTTPPQTDSYGHAAYYAPPGIYTVLFYSTEIAGQTFVLQDQIITGPTNLPQFNNDSTQTVSIHPVPNGSTVAFFLSAAPQPPTSLTVFLNGLLVTNFAFANQTIIFQTPPPLGAVITARYQI